MSDFATYQNLAQRVDQNGGIMTAEMGDLRDAHGAGKLGSMVVTAIHDRLESLGLGHAPAELPTNQWQRVLIYRKGSALARVVEAINSVSEESDAILKEAVGKNSGSTEIVRRIRELVCD